MKKFFIFLNSLLFFLPFVTFADNNVLNWVKTSGGSGYDEGYSIGLDYDKNIYITGPFTGTVDLDPSDAVYNVTSAGDVDTFIAKFSPLGSLIWAKEIGGSADDRSFSMAVDADGNSYTTGRFASVNADFDPGDSIYTISTSGNYDVYIVKLDINGNFVWAKKLGGTNWDWPYTISIDLSDNVYTTGGFYGTADFDPGASVYSMTSSGGNPAIYDDVFISKLDKDGNFVWAKKMGGAGGDWGAYVLPSSDGESVYVTGGFYGTADFDPGTSTYNLVSSGNYDGFVAKLDSSGNFVWAKKIGGAGEDYGNGLSLDSDDNIYITGPFVGTADFDPGTGVSNMVSSGSYDNFILKLDPSGNFIWSKKTGGTGDDWGYIIKTRVEGNDNYVYIGGTFSATADFDPGSNTYNLVSNGGYDNFIMKLDSSGNFVWANGFGGSSDDWLNYFVLDSDLGIYLSGSFMGTADFEPGDLDYNFTSNGDSDIFVMKLANDITPPSITEFDLPEVYSSLNLPITSFISEDNVAVVGYIVSESNVEPLPDDSNWLVNIPTEYVFSSAGQKTLYAWVKDEEGNISEMSSAQILIDTDNPSIVLNGKKTVTVYRNKEYVDKGATATDYTDGDLTSNIVVVNNVDTSVLGTYTITYNVSDLAGNNAVEVSRTVKVINKPTTGSIPFIFGTNIPLHEFSNQVSDVNLSKTEEAKNDEEEIVSTSDNDNLTDSNDKLKITTLDNSKSVMLSTSRILKRGMIGDDVKELQIYLNTHNYLLASTGVGSLGKETTYFGTLTKQAVIKFQLANSLIGDGIVGPKTWAKIDSIK